ncbi:MAG: hypothetical protein Q8R74_03240 [Methylophilus sp.]|nr:hypothetical protein [Methylophilus sp.]
MKISRSQDDLKKLLQDNISNLIDSCISFDHGDRAKGQVIAMLLRTLLHHAVPKSTSYSLLEQMSLRTGNWYAMEAPVHVMQDIDTCTITYWNFGSGGVSAEPNFNMFQNITKKDFKLWWNDPVANSQIHGSYSRQDFVTAVANQDGAHIAPKIFQKYAALKDGTFVSNIQATVGGVQSHIPDLHYAGVRQIAHELLITLIESCPDAFKKQYSPKTKIEHIEMQRDLKVISEFKNDPDKLNDYGVFVQTRFNDLDRALRFYLLALDVNPIHKHALGNAALIYGKLQKNAHADDFFQRVLAIDPNDCNNLAKYGMLLTKVHNLDADQYFIKALELDEFHPLALKNYPVFFNICER